MLHPKLAPFPIITTPTLVLRETVSADCNRLFKLRSDEEIMRFITHIKAQSIEEIEALIKKFAEQIVNGTGINWTICLPDNDELIGNVCLFNIQKEHYRAELGYMLDPAFQGKGIMKEAVAAAIKYGFDTIGLHSIEAHIDPRNLASQKVLARAGFVQEALFKENFCYNGIFTDTAVYSLLNK